MKLHTLGAAAALFFAASPAFAQFVIEVDIDGQDDGVLTYSPNFGFGSDTTTASQSAASSAVGLTGGDSIYGGNATSGLDTYLFTYTPSVDGNNRDLAAGTELNDDGDVASGVEAGGSGAYNVYGTWPFTDNVSGGTTTFTLSDDQANVLFTTEIDQNGGGSGTGNEWVFLGSATLDADTTYTLSQVAGSNTFVSMRAAGVLFDAVAVPEPMGIAAAAGFGLLALRRRR